MLVENVRRARSDRIGRHHPYRQFHGDDGPCRLYCHGVELLEREGALADLGRALESARTGAGRFVVVSGEAGGGKSALVDAFSDAAQVGRVMRGACDDLVIPVPFGPLLDLARITDPALESALLGGDRQRVFTRLLDLLEQKPSPTLVVIEDIHWIDQASAEMLAAVAQRIDRLPVLMVLTLRPEGVDADHPGRLIGARVPATAALRIELEPLSLEALMSVTDPSAASRILAATGGNPFFVSQLLQSDGAMTATVTDAIAGRVARLPPETRQLLEVVAVNPTAAENVLLDRVSPGWERWVEPAESAGLVDVSAAGVSFRHDLTRRAVDEAMRASRRRAIHASIQKAAVDLGLPAGRIVHHAAAAGAVDVLVSFGPAAAEQARTAGSHREAAAHYRGILEHAEMLEPVRRAEMFEAASLESWTVNDPERAQREAGEALGLRRAHGGPPEAIGRNLRRIARVRWFLGDGDAAESLLDEAIEIMDGGGDDVREELASALAYRGLITGIRHSAGEAQPWIDRALTMVEGVDDDRLRALVLNDVGTVRYLESGDPGTLVESIVLAERAGLHIDVVRGHVNLASCALAHRRYQDCRGHLHDASHYADDNQVLAFGPLADAIRAQMLFETGEWDGAATITARLQNQPSFARLPASIVLARLKVRRGDPDAPEAITEAVTRAQTTGEAQRIAPAVGAAAELAWMQQRLDEFLPTLETAHSVALRSGSARWVGETAIWLRAAGRLETMPDHIEEPALLMMEARWEEAASAWEALEAPYEAAVARALADEVTTVMEGLAQLDRMGAAPMAKRTRDRLARMGVEKIPRGPRPTTASNAAGLTSRQMEVLGLVVDGHTNAEIGERLFLSTRTVDHHVAAILLKLGVTSRRDVETAARELGLLG